MNKEKEMATPATTLNEGEQKAYSALSQRVSLLEDKVDHVEQSLCFLNVADLPKKKYDVKEMILKEFGGKTMAQRIAKSSESINPLDTQVGGDHYKQFPIQPIVFCHVNNLGNIESEVISYVCRHKFKNGAQDLEKAIHSLRILIDLAYPENKVELR